MEFADDVSAIMAGITAAHMEHMASTDRMIEREERAHAKLIRLGGRPSHPCRDVDEVVDGLANYPDIVYYWRNSPELDVFVAQLDDWRKFLARRNSRMQELGAHRYIEALKARLSRSGFDFTPYTARLDSVAENEVPSLKPLSTWIEYFNDQFDLQESWQKELEPLQATWDKEWQKLVGSGVLSPEEAKPHNAFTFCYRSGAEITCETQRRRVADTEFDDAHQIYRGYSRSKRKTATEIAEMHQHKENRDKLKEVVDEMSRRHEFIRRFLQKTDKFRAIVEKAQRHDMLLTWILQQLPLVAQECLGTENSTFEENPNPVYNRFETPLPQHKKGVAVTTSGKSPTDTVDESIPSASQPENEQATFAKFKELPQEIRRNIWMECLPPESAAHFFSIVNKPMPLHLRDAWNFEDFRVQRTTKYASGYRIVYPLVASCKEAREVIWMYYKTLMLRDAPYLQAPNWSEPADFSNCEWIPPNDLIVLCFPPVAGRLDSRHCISFEYSPKKPNRHVAVLASKEILEMTTYGSDIDILNSFSELDDSEQLRFASIFLSALLCRKDGDTTSRASRLGKLYLGAESWGAESCSYRPSGSSNTVDTVDKLRKGSFVVTFPGTIKLTPMMEPPCRPLVDNVREYLDAQPSERPIWWLNAGTKGLGVMQYRDDIDEIAYEGLIELAGKLLNGGLALIGAEPDVRLQFLCWVSDDVRFY
ncbi:hypothetical protein K4F52_004489 [Lecanicillium sp. MT-2017a]|nr:hypothetical protein K4F52_004489 [Lecanicillium sp. MT-2017a]